MKKFKPLTWEKEPVLSKDLLPNISSKELPQEFSKLVDENFDELIGEEPKQETLEDAAERMYSEEEVDELVNNLIDKFLNYNGSSVDNEKLKWFYQQIKKEIE